MQVGSTKIGKTFLDLRKYICTGNGEKGLSSPNRTCSSLLQFGHSKPMCITRQTDGVLELADGSDDQDTEEREREMFMYDLTT